jgi:hypothetical protein
VFQFPKDTEAVTKEEGQEEEGNTNQQNNYPIHWLFLLLYAKNHHWIVA